MLLQCLWSPPEGYDPNTLEAIQLEDGSTVFIHRPVSLPTSSTVLTVQADMQLEELAVEEKNVAFDLDTITVLKEYATQVRLHCFFIVCWLLRTVLPLNQCSVVVKSVQLECGKPRFECQAACS